jgi:hypothetical protein
MGYIRGIGMLARTIPLDARIRVAVIFQNEEIRAVWFGLDGIKHEVREVCYTWVSRVGSILMRHYAVWDGKDNWTLTYNTINHMWVLGRAVLE